MKKMRFTMILTSLVFAFFLSTKVSARSVIYQDDSYTKWSPATTTPLGQTFVSGFNGTLNTAQLYLQKSGGTSPNCQVVRSPLGVSDDYGTDNQTISATSKTLYTFTWSNTPTIAYGDAYLIALNCTNQANLEIYGSASNTINAGSSCITTDRGTTCRVGSTSTIQDFYLVLEDTANSSSIGWATTVTTTAEFSTWPLYATIDSSLVSEIGNYSVVVRFALTEDGIDYAWQNYSPFINDEFGGSYNVSFPKSTRLTAGLTYYARAYIYSTTTPSEFDYGNEIARSDVWTFYLNSNTSTNSYPGSGYITLATTTTSTGSTDFSCNYAWPINKGCELLKFLFYPSEESIGQFTLLKEDLQNKPPFGYVTAYTTSLNSLQSASSTTSTATIGQVGMISWIGNTFKSIISWVLYIVFAFWVLNRLRHFSLHG